MAKRITRIEKLAPDTASEQQQANEQLMAALAEQKDSLLLLLHIIGELNKVGILEALYSFLKSRHEIGVIAMTQLNKPGAHHILKNGMNLLQFLADIEPAELNRLLSGVSAGVRNAAAEGEGDKPLGMWNMMKTVREPEVGASLNVLFNFLRGMGSGMNSKEVH